MSGTEMFNDDHEVTEILDHEPTEIIDREPTEVLVPEPDTASEPERRVRIGYLVMGLLFLGIALLSFLGVQDVLSADDFTLAGPIVLIVAGSLGLVASVVNRARGSES
jgi:hypothetical protein